MRKRMILSLPRLAIVTGALFFSGVAHGNPASPKAVKDGISPKARKSPAAAEKRVLKKPAPAFTIRFADNAVYTFTKAEGVWVAIRASRKRADKYKAKTVERLCAKQRTEKAYITDQGIFLVLEKPGEPYVEKKRKRVVLPWAIGVTYEDTGHFANHTAKLVANTKGKLVCFHEDNR